MDPFLVIAFDEFNKMNEHSQECLLLSMSSNSLQDDFCRDTETNITQMDIESENSQNIESDDTYTIIPKMKVAFAYPSPVLTFIQNKPQYLLVLFLLGIVSFRHKQLRKLLIE